MTTGVPVRVVAGATGAGGRVLLDTPSPLQVHEGWPDRPAAPVPAP